MNAQSSLAEAHAWAERVCDGDVTMAALIIAVRKRAELGQERFGKLIATSPHTVRRIEQGKKRVTPDEARYYAEQLDLCKDYMALLAEMKTLRRLPVEPTC